MVRLFHLLQLHQEVCKGRVYGGRVHFLQYLCFCNTLVEAEANAYSLALTDTRVLESNLFQVRCIQMYASKGLLLRCMLYNALSLCKELNNFKVNGPLTICQLNFGNSRKKSGSLWQDGGVAGANLLSSMHLIISGEVPQTPDCYSKVNARIVLLARQGVE